MIVFLNSCESKKESADMKNIFLGEHFTDDNKSLETSLTNEYDLDELKSFFMGSNENEEIMFEVNSKMLTFSEVNRRYPVEVLRTGGYSVYKVSQGGYFYVFWVSQSIGNTQNSEPSVYFSAYLSSDVFMNSFDSLIPMINTAEDVKKIDPNFELSFLISHGIFSYSYLNEQNLLEVEYLHQENLKSYDDLIIKEMRIIPREAAPSRYSTVLSKDLP